MTIAIASAVLLVLGTTLAEAQSLAPLELEACNVALEEAGSKARFAETVVYELTTKADGGVETVRSVREPKLRDFVDLASFEACIRRWRLRPGARYTILFRFGSADDLLSRWMVDVKDGDTPIIRLVLPRPQANAAAHAEMSKSQPRRRAYAFRTAP